jgi:glyoxylase-like metal-dependent hydrolase (beta-lactamase superfamily II)
VRLVRPRLDEAETAWAQVQARGFSPDDVRAVVLTHLDVDHAGAVPDFPRAAVHVHERELDAATARRSSGDRARYVPTHLPGADRVVVHPDGGEAWLGMEGVRPLFDDEPDLLLVPLPGHTVGHCGVAVRVGERWLLHGGDAWFFHGQIAARPHAPLFLQGFQRYADTDNPRRVASQARVQALVQAHPDVDAFCAHDPLDLDRLQGRAGGAAPPTSTAGPG